MHEHRVYQSMPSKHHSHANYVHLETYITDCTLIADYRNMSLVGFKIMFLCMTSIFFFGHLSSHFELQITFNKFLLVANTNIKKYFMKVILKEWHYCCNVITEIIICEKWEERGKGKERLEDDEELRVKDPEIVREGPHCTHKIIGFVLNIGARAQGLQNDDGRESISILCFFQPFFLSFPFYFQYNTSIPSSKCSFLI